MLNQPTNLSKAGRLFSALVVAAVVTMHRVFDRAIEEGQTLVAGDLVTLDLDTGYWRESTAGHVDAPAWEAATAYAVGDIIQPTTPNAHFYKCTTAGISMPTTEPTFPTNGSAVTDDDDATAWAADTVYAAGALVKPTTPNGHYYKVTARDGDFKSHATTEPTWPTDGSTVVDDALTWEDQGTLAAFTDQGAFDLLTRTFGVVLDDVTSDTAEHPEAAIFEAGALLKSETNGIPPTSCPVGYVLDNLILC